MSNLNKVFFQFVYGLIFFLFLNYFTFGQQPQGKETPQISLQLKAKLSGHTKKINYITFSPDGKYIATVSQDNTVRLWDSNTGVLKEVLSGNDKIKWEEQKWGAIQRLKTEGKPIDDLSDKTILSLSRTESSTSPDGKWILIWKTDEKRKTILSLWDNKTNQLNKTFQITPNLSISSIYWSPNSKMFLVDNHSRIRLFNISSEQALMKLPYKGCVPDTFFGDNNCQPFIFNANGSIFLKEKAPLKIWRAETGELLTEIKTVKVPVSFSPTDKRLLVTTSEDEKTALLWDITVK